MGCSDELQLCVAGEQIFLAAMKYLERLLPGTSGALCMINASRNLMGEVARWGESGMLTGGALPPDSCCGLRLGQVRWRKPGVSKFECTHFLGAPPSRYVCVPMVAHGETLGTLTRGLLTRRRL